MIQIQPVKVSGLKRACGVASTWQILWQMFASWQSILTNTNATFIKQLWNISFCMPDIRVYMCRFRKATTQPSDTTLLCSSPWPCEGHGGMQCSTFQTQPRCTTWRERVIEEHWIDYSSVCMFGTVYEYETRFLVQTSVYDTCTCLEPTQ